MSHKTRHNVNNHHNKFMYIAENLSIVVTELIW